MLFLLFGPPYLLLLLGAISFAFTTAQGYSWQYTSSPKQCGTLSLNITGKGGHPPYYALLVPVGSTPLDVEVRGTQYIEFNDSSTLGFQLRYPKNSGFVIVVSDQAQFGSGGTGAASTVGDSDDDSCFDSKKSIVHPAWFDTTPQMFTQCGHTRINWDQRAVQGTPAFYGVIPGGQSFPVPNNTITTIASNDTGFGWNCNVRVNTQMILVGADNRGFGPLGEMLFTINQGGTLDNSCLSADSPSSTPGSPAGSYPTSTETNGSSPTSTGGADSENASSDSASKSPSTKVDAGPIIGGVTGGVAVLLAAGLMLFFCFRRKRKQERVDILLEDAHEAGTDEEHDRYRAEPYVLSASEVSDTTRPGSPAQVNGGERRSLLTVANTGKAGAGYAASLSNRSSTHPGSPGGESSSAGSESIPPHKSASLSPLRLVTVHQHEDGGRLTAAREEEEMIELPPAYTDIKREPSGHWQRLRDRAGRSSTSDADVISDSQTMAQTDSIALDEEHVETSTTA